MSEDVHEDRQGEADDSPEGALAIDRLRKARAARPNNRRDVLTKRPLDYDEVSVSFSQASKGFVFGGSKSVRRHGSPI